MQQGEVEVDSLEQFELLDMVEVEVGGMVVET